MRILQVGMGVGTMLASGRGLSAEASPPPPEKPFSLFQKAARSWNEVLELPAFETTPEALRKSAVDAIRRANLALDRIARVKPSKATYANTAGARDDALYQVTLVANRANLIKETSPDAALRQAATEAAKQLQEWAVGIDYREDVYRAIQACADRHPALPAEESRLLSETVRDYRRAGLALPTAERAEVESLRKELARLCTDFQSHLNQAERVVKFTRAELEGVPDEFLNLPEVKTGADEYTIRASVIWQVVTVMENARREATRKRLKTERYLLGADGNVDRFRQVIRLRARIAARLGYASWADYQIEPKMARNAATVRDFLANLRAGLEPKFDEELAAMRELKARDTGEADARIEHWDWRYYANQLVKSKYALDAEELRVFFPYDRTLQGMFRTYEHVFGLRIDAAAPPYRWVPDLQLHVVSDAATGEPLGALYLDMFPREGKYGHFAQFDLVPGKQVDPGKYQRPVAALICNFPAPSAGRPSLLSYNDVQTLFHEFGHALHSLLTRARTGRFSGTGVPGDFVEVPSQILENWARDKAVLDTFAADYRDPARRISQDLLERLQQVRRATIGTFYRRQLSFGVMDLVLHGPPAEVENLDPVQVANDAFRDVFLAAPEDTAFIAGFGHLVGGYDGGYYGYAWADAIAADLATAFEQSPQRYGDTQLGRRLRDEIYAPGGSREVEESIRAFLGRERSLQPFFKSLGME